MGVSAQFGRSRAAPVTEALHGDPAGSVARLVTMKGCRL
jgi:hypothetical protein